jgi:hypothetical protein
MAHFAEIEQKTDPSGFTTGQKWIVKRVVVVGNDIPVGLTTLGQNDMHVEGEEYCNKLFKGGTWKQTSYNHNFRHRFAGRGMVYDETNDVFYPQQPYASWTLNTTTWKWEAPVAYPTILSVEMDKGTGDGIETVHYNIYWSEATSQWLATLVDDQYEWNPTTSQWDATGG